MIKAAILLLSVLASIGLVYACGLWILLAMFALMGMSLMFSTQNDNEELFEVVRVPADQVTGFHSMAARL